MTKKLVTTSSKRKNNNNCDYFHKKYDHELPEPTAIQ